MAATWEQLDLFGNPHQDSFDAQVAARLSSAIAQHLGGATRIDVQFNDNRSTMVSFRRSHGMIRLRLHAMFRDAPSEVVSAIAEYAGRGRREASATLDAYIASKHSQILKRRQPATRLRTRGRYFDLSALFDAVNQEHFQGGIRARIGWSKGRLPKRRRRSIRLGVYDHRAREIRIHPALDRHDVPGYFVEFIVFHEMLHQLFPSERSDGRNVHHPKAYRDRERAFPRYLEARAWEKANLHLLLRSERR